MPFVKKQKLTEPTTLAGVVLDPPKAPTLKKFQLDYGKARARVEEFAVQLDEARRDFARISGASVSDENLDAMAVSTIMTQSQKKVVGLEAALKLAMQQMEAAEVALANAGEQVQRDILRKKLIRLNEAGRVVDAWLDSVKPIIEAYNAERKDVLALGYRDITSQINVANLSFQTYLFRPCAPMANCQTGYAVFQTEPRWSAPWSMSNPQPDLADTVKLT
jgi:hypothetical protein